MGLKQRSEKFFRGWFPKEPTMPSNQIVSIFNVLKPLELVRIAYSVMLGALLVTPFGVYHSISEPYITSYLWGYDLPIGYIGLFLSIFVALSPRVHTLRSLRFSSIMPIIGLSLLLTLIFSPNYYFINLQNGTSFSASQIDVDFQLGNSAVVIFSFLSLAVGLTSVVMFSRKKQNKFSVGIGNMNVEKSRRQRIRGWIPKEPSMPSSNIKAVKAPMSEREKAYKLKVGAIFLVVLGVLFGLGAAGYEYAYFVGNGVTSANATIYSIILWIFVIGVFWLAALLTAFKAKRIQRYITRN